MKIKDLIANLDDLDGDLEILLSSDPEGNSYSTVGGLDLDFVYEDGEGVTRNALVIWPSGAQYEVWYKYDE